ncbi:MAG TPA: hypothetical protein VK013_08865 [Myxococcaceae bacterium]|nr:hypothetical protein [Myxococcaceae bacterium]
MRVFPLCLFSCLLSASALAQTSPRYEVEVQPTQVQDASGRWTTETRKDEVGPPPESAFQGGSDSTVQGDRAVSVPRDSHAREEPLPVETYGQPDAPSPQSPASGAAELGAWDEAPATASPSLLPADSLADAEPELDTAITNATHVDGHRRIGNFLAGPGSFDFILHHTLMGAAGGLAITGIPGRFDVGDVGTRTTMLLGTLAGAGLGFATSAWYQFNNWIEPPAAHYGIIHTLVGALFLTGLVDTFSDDPLVLASTALVGAEIAAWMSIVLGTGKLPAAQGLMLSSGAAWGLAYGALLIATMATSGTDFDGVGDFLPALMIAPGIGLGAMALASIRYTPSVEQLVRANLFGAGVGSGVLLITALAAGGFNQPLPYVLGLVSSAAAMSLVTLLWAEPDPEVGRWTHTGRREPARPYSNPWW